MAHKDDPKRLVKLEATDMLLLQGSLPYMIDYYKSYKNEVMVDMLTRVRAALYASTEVVPNLGDRLRDT